jgi:tRNA (cmo5U34)-methyltransferase
MNKAKEDFSFAKLAPDFRRHIEASIPGYKNLIRECVRQSVGFVQPGTHVYDVGCATGHLLVRVRRANRKIHDGVLYTEIDVEPAFTPGWGKLLKQTWGKHQVRDLCFELRDACDTHYSFRNASLILSLFTVQFLPPRDKAALLARFHAALVPGGALFIAEKTLAETPRLQETLTSSYLEYKLEAGFTPEQILAKNRALQAQMTTWTESELRDALQAAGFRELTAFWRGSFFVGYIALK